MLMGGLLLGGQGEAFASFNGSANGDVVWAAQCSFANGQQLFSAANSASGETCPGATPAYNPVTDPQAFDSMPYFSASGATVYFASDRSGANFSIWSTPYPNTATSSPDAASPVANLTGTGLPTDDYAPTVSADGSTLAFVGCGTGTGCSVYTQSPIGVGTPTLVPGTQNLVSPPNTTSGDGDRAEINPAFPDQITYVNTSDHIVLVSRSAAFTPVDLSANGTCATCASGSQSIGTAADDHPDWSPDGLALVFDSTRNSGITNQSGRTVFVMTNLSATNPTVTPRWSSLPAGLQQEEPVYAPYTPTTSDAKPDLAWVSVAQGANIDVEDGTNVNTPDAVTANHTGNIEVTWQPVPLAAQTPEAPLAVLLPGGAAALLVGFGLISRRRYRRSAA